jgi:carbamoyl-phosphate synthase large subunit
MRSTGEVMGIDSDFGRAYAKSQIQAGNTLPLSGRILVSVKSEDHDRVAEAVKELTENGFDIIATTGTAAKFKALGVESELVAKVGQGHPNTVERINEGDVDLVINTVGSDPRSVSDSSSIRRAALTQGIPYFTTAAAACAAVGGIRALQSESIGVRALQETHRRIGEDSN